jgi:hypothetical protein
VHRESNLADKEQALMAVMVGAGTTVVNVAGPDAG